MSNNFQENFWSGEFGKNYTDRNTFSPEELDKMFIELYGVSNTSLNEDFLNNIVSKDAKILEVGCNVGNNLRLLQKMGYKNLYGIELQSYAVERSKELTKGVNIIQASAFDIPFKDEYFDLVFTFGVLIHIAPENLSKIMGEIVRCSKKYVWGLEYYTEDFMELNYRDNQNAMWKGNYANEYLKNHSQLKLLRQEKYKYIENANVDSMFLLSK